MSTSFFTAEPRRTAQMDAMSWVLAENWWAIALRGIVGILFGLFAFFLPAATILSLVIVLAAYMFVDGVFAILAGVRAARQGERWGLLVAEGVMGIVAGVIAFLWPGITVLALVLLTAAWALLSGGLTLAAAFKLETGHGRWWMVLGGVASLIFGILLAIAPLVGALVLTWWVGAYAFVFGASLLVLAYRLRIKQIDHARLTRAPRPA